MRGIRNDLSFIVLDEASRRPLTCQVYDAIRAAILSGRLASEARLPSSRELAQSLRVSRTTIVNAFEQLRAEGYLESGVGRGTFVSRFPPEDQLAVAGSKALLADRSNGNSTSKSTAARSPIRVARRGKELEFALPLLQNRTESIRPFRPGIPALDQFPLKTWTRLARQRERSSTIHLSYGHPLGYWPLRETIAEYVQAFRGVRCDADQVVIVNGTQQALDCITRLLIDRRDEVFIENPGYRFARAVFQSAGARLVPVPVDQNGMDVEFIVRRRVRRRLAYVTPSHQFPLGVTLSIERRMKLLSWAAQTESTIIEDDYDSEYRYAMRPIPAMQGLDQEQRVIYIGSFSKVIFPSLGIGYAVIPRELGSAWQQAVLLSGRPPSTLDQMTLTDFIQQGHFGRHLRRMRKIHEARRSALVDEIQQRLSAQLEIVGADAGLHCAVRFRENRDDRDISARLRAAGVLAPALSDYYLPATRGKRVERLSGLVLGFACSPPPVIRAAVRKCCDVLL